MKVLVLNSGSSSLKYQLFDMETEEVMAVGLVERVGLENSVLSHEARGNEKEIVKDIANHKEALRMVMDLLDDKEIGVISSMNDIEAVGHRVVHGGENFASSALITDDVYKAIEDCIPLAPLHNPANKDGIDAIKELMPEVPQVAVFDTAFHQTMKPDAYLYAIPYKYYEKYKIRRYGFHGTSHNYVSAEGAKFIGEDINKLNIITVHIGNGGSIAAIKDGKVVDTTMGFTPLEGLIMGTRCGDMDPAIVTFLESQEKLTAVELDTILNKKSGVLGVSGVSSDMRDVEAAAEDGNERATIALNMYLNRIVKYIGSYTALLGGVDLIVFTAGVGENSISTRKSVVDRLGYLGITLDEEKNKVRAKARVISTDDSKSKVIIMPTNEELVIAKDTFSLAK